MISQEIFETVIAKVAEGQDISSTEAAELISTIVELDSRGVIAEQALDFVLYGSEQALLDVAKAAIKVIGIRDHAKQRKITSLAAEASGRLVAGLQILVAQAVSDLQNVTNSSAVADVAKELPEGETTA